MASSERYRKLKYLAIDLLGGKCEKCRVDLLGNIRLAHFHHIDGNRDDDGKENIKLLCLDCHSETKDHRRA